MDSRLRSAQGDEDIGGAGKGGGTGNSLSRVILLSDGQANAGLLDPLLIERDAAMSAKELHFSARKMSSRLAACEAVPYSPQETQSASIPAYLRRKVSEGKGRDGNRPEPEPKA